MDHSGRSQRFIEHVRCNHMIPEYVTPLAVRLIWCEYRRSALV